MNRYTNQFRQQFEKKVVDVYAKVAIGATGAPTLSATNSKGVLSVTRNSAGLYTFVFGTNTVLPKDTYVKLLGISHVFASGSSAPAAPSLNIVAISVATVNVCSLQVQFRDVSGTAADPANGETLYIDFCMGDSTAP